MSEGPFRLVFLQVYAGVVYKIPREYIGGEYATRAEAEAARHQHELGLLLRYIREHPPCDRGNRFLVEYAPDVKVDVEKMKRQFREAVYCYWSFAEPVEWVYKIVPA